MIPGPSPEISYTNITFQPWVKLYTPRKESFPILLRYIDVTRVTNTTLDVLQERRLDSYWNIDGSRDLSYSWTSFTQFTLLKEKPPDRYMWSRERLSQRQATSRPDHLWLENLEKYVEKLRDERIENWAIEKTKMENARTLRGIYFIEPEDEEFEETIGNAL